MEPWYAAVNAVGRAALRALAVDVRAHGAEHLPREGGVLLASNHVSFVDFVMVEKVAVTRGRYVRFLTRYDAWVPPVSFVLDRMRHVPVDRRAPAGAYLQARAMLREGEAVCAFPEGGVSHSFTVRALMRGVAALARDTGLPVVPVAVWGSQRIFSVGEAGRVHDLTRGRVVDVALGEPMRAAGDTDLTQWTRGLGDRLTTMLESLQLLPHHRPHPGEHAPWYPAHLGGDAPTRQRALSLDEPPLNALAPSWGPGAVVPPEAAAPDDA